MTKTLCLHFIPLWEWTWHHNTSLQECKHFNCAIFEIVHVFSYNLITACLFQSCPTEHTQWHHIHFHRGIKFKLVAHRLSIVNSSWHSDVSVTAMVILTAEYCLTFFMVFLIGLIIQLKGCGMGPWLVLVSPCFRKNVVATCKIGSFLCSLDNLLQKNVLFSFLKIKFQNGAHLKKRLFLTYFSHFLVTREKLQKIPSAHISNTYTYFAHPIDFFCLINFEKNTNLSGTVSLWYESWCWFLFAPFWNNQ